MAQHNRTHEVRISAIEATLGQHTVLLESIAARLGADMPAKPQPKAVRKPAKKAKAPAKAPVAKVTKGAQTRETLSRKDWNRTLTAKARFHGGPAYKAITTVLWADAQAMRDSGMTPDEALARLVH